jgi:hypothetical protein
MSAEERMLDAILAYLGRRLGPRAVLRGIRLDAVGSDGIRQEIRLKPLALGVAGDEDEGLSVSPIRAAVVEVLGDAEGALKGQAIARRAGRSYSGTFRAALASMVREGVLILGPEGYELGDEGGQDGQASQPEEDGG